MPPLFSGLRIASTLAVIGVVVGEMVGGNTGLGYLLVFGEGQANTPMVFVSIILMTVIGIAAYWSVAIAERFVLHYLPKRTLETARVERAWFDRMRPSHSRVVRSIVSC